MADPIYDSADEAFHEIQLSGKQLVFLFMATTVISVVIFLCGVFVGRGVRAEDIGVDPSVSAASNPAPSVPPAAAPVTTEPPTPPSEAPLTYQQRLESEKAPDETLKPRTDPARTQTQTPRPAATAERPSAALASATAGARPGTWAIQVQALRDRDVATQVVQRLRNKGYPAFLVVPTLGAPTQLFRVQVGRFAERSEAQEVEVRLKKEEQFDTFIVR